MIDITKCRKSRFPGGATVACQGVLGAYSQLAADRVFERPDIMYMRTFDGVFRAVSEGLCRYGILPVENSNAGSVTAVYDLMKIHNFYIARSVKVSISHMLLANKGARSADIKEVYTHEQAAAQCSKFIDDSSVELNICGNTAQAAQFVSKSERLDIAAIASENCAQIYGLTVLAKNLQNNKNNYTRFICISKECEIFDGADRVSLMLSVEHKPGALYAVMKRFASLGINLTKLESRPIPDTDFEFMFYFDIQAQAYSKDVLDLLRDLSKSAAQFNFLGNYTEINA